jgi:AcrR family transcriptional regulator
LETRERILSQAFRLFLKKGFPNVSVNELIRQVGVTKGGFYHHFRSKDELYIEVINTYFLALVQEIKTEIARPSRSVLEVLRRLVGLTLRSYREILALTGPEQFRGTIALMFSGLDRFDHVLKRISTGYNGMLDVFVEVLEKGKESGEVRRDLDSAATAFSVMAIGEGTVVLWAIDAGPENKEELMNRQLEILWRGIASPGSAEAD